MASELNAAILKAEHSDNTQPKLAIGLKLVLWAQNELDKKRIRYNRMVDLSTGKIEDSKWNGRYPNVYSSYYKKKHFHLSEYIFWTKFKKYAASLIIHNKFQKASE